MIMPVFTTGKIYKDKLFCSCANYNGLFQVDLDSGNVVFLSLFPNETCISEMLHRNSVLYEKYLCFLPQEGSFLQIYDIENAEFQSVNLKGIKAGPYDGFICDGELNVYSLNGGILILKYSLLKMKITYEYVSNGETSKHIYQKIYKQNDLICMLEYDTNVMDEVDYKTGELRQHYLEIPSSINYSVSRSGFWFVSSDNTAVSLWNSSSNTVMSYIVEGKRENETFSGVVEIGAEVFLVPIDGDIIRKLSEDKFVPMHKICLSSRKNNASTFFISNERTDSHYYMLPLNIDSFIIIDDKGCISQLQYKWINEEEYDENMFRTEIKEKLAKSVYENEWNTLANYISWI